MNIHVSKRRFFSFKPSPPASVWQSRTRPSPCASSVRPNSAAGDPCPLSSRPAVHAGICKPPNDGVWFFKTMGFISQNDAYIWWVWTGFVQWLFNDCSMIVQWLANGCHHALCPPFSASSINAIRFLLKRGRDFAWNEWNGESVSLHFWWSFWVKSRRLPNFAPKVRSFNEATCSLGCKEALLKQ